MFNMELAKSKLKSGGWSYRAAAAVLDVRYQYLSDVLNGHRSSLRLMRAIEQLPTRAEWENSNAKQQN